MDEIEHGRDRGPADGDAIDASGRHPHAYGDGLAVLAARAHALVELEVVADTAHPRQRVGAIADEGGALDRLRDLTVLDQVSLAGREDELAVGDVDLPAAAVHGVETGGGGADDVGGIVRPG